MGPKKKEKSKEAEWLECFLCKKWITPHDAELHSKSCDADHPFIFNYCLKGKTVKAEDLKDEEGCQATKGVVKKDDTVWLSIPTMAICGLSIGQNVVINGRTVKKVWPLKGLPLSHVGLSKDARSEMNAEDGTFIKVTKLTWNNEVVHSLVLRLKDSNPIFEKEEFGIFLSSHLDGKFVAMNSHLSINYFGQICNCVVAAIEVGEKRATSSTSHTLMPANLSRMLVEKQPEDVKPDSQKSPQCASTPLNPIVDTPRRDGREKFENSDLSDSQDISQLAESFTDMDISNVSSNNSSIQETPIKVKYPNLVTPMKSGDELTKSSSTSSQSFGKIVSGYSTVSVQSPKNLQAGENPETKHTLKDVAGMSEHIELLMKRISQALQPTSFSKCILIHGPPGTGKSLLVRAVTSHLQMHTTFVSGTDIWSKLFGEAEANLRKIFTAAQDRSPAVIVFDDLHVICPKRAQNSAGQQENRVVGTLLSLIDGVSNLRDSSAPKIVIVGISNNTDGIDPALRRAGRFGCELEIGVPTAVKRGEILSLILSKVCHELTPEEIGTVAQNAHGYVGADLAALVNEAFILAMTRHGVASSSSSPPSSMDSACISVRLEDLTQASYLIKPSALREIQLEVPQVRWTDIGGMTEVKMRLREAVELPMMQPELYHRLGIEPPKGLLMYGPPGCSKTMIAKAVATECRLNFLAVKGPELFNQYVGESEKNIRQVFHKAKSAAPSVIFFDEIDAIAATRGSSSGGSSGVDDRVLTQLLTEMDGLECLKDVFIMAATNRPDKIDRALLRPGRFDSLIYVPLPDDNTRREILQNKLKKMGVCEHVKLEDLVEATLDYSGAEIIQMCQEAAFCALRENINTRKVDQRHFDTALKKVVPQIDVDLLKIYQKFSSGR